MKLVLAQLNYTVGDIEGNLEKILDAYKTISEQDALLICSELALTGYYPQDLVLKESLLVRQSNALKKLMDETEGKRCGIVIGYIEKNNQVTGKGLFNALALLSNGKQVFQYHKRLLPTYNIFDEARHFQPGSNVNVFNYKGVQLGFLICEDAWAKTKNFKYSDDPVNGFKQHELDLVISINASPNNLGKMQERIDVINRVATQTQSPVVYINQIGGNDELVFDGASFAVNKIGKLVCQMKPFEEQIYHLELENLDELKANAVFYNENELILGQTVLGIRDYVKKCGFSKVVIGSSGGIDSAVTLAICSKALGPENVIAITMPSKFSSEGSVNDSVTLCNNLGVKLLNASIAEEFELAVKRFEFMTGENPSTLTQENMQARIRGRILMEYSNHFGALVISTGNKSEMSVGYATLYGDMNGGINPLGDLYKMEVYALARFINEKSGREIIPDVIIQKEPSAELSEGQVDSDSLPEYPLLDAILKLYIEGDLLDVDESEKCHLLIEKYQVLNDDVERIHRMVDKAEFKRRQAPPIIRVQKRSFGMGRWLPVAAKY
ncbi:NAD+ synthase [Aliikangiella sp. IMCC44359]|uniref:NAD+ synthase n=1 Tax=Aliikangiella sp. IMCC44359 TaxID=3459125 RepID=UPI00403AD8F4